MATLVQLNAYGYSNEAYFLHSYNLSQPSLTVHFTLCTTFEHIANLLIFHAILAS